MVPEPIIWREPEQFAAGDTLKYQRNLPDYLPSDGWSITLTITAQTGRQVAQVVSQPDPTNNFHTFLAPNFLANQPAGIYIFSEQLVCAAGGEYPGEEHNFYYFDQFRLAPNLAAGGAIAPVLTRAQRMLQMLDTTYCDLIQRRLGRTSVQRTELEIKNETSVLNEIKYWQEVRNAEVQVERAKNGRSPGNVSQVVMAIGF